MTTITGSSLVPSQQSSGLPVSNEVDFRGWDLAINLLLGWWMADDPVVEEEGTEPSKTAIDRAIQLAQKWRNKGESSPTRVVPDQEGGLIFELHVEQTYQSLRVSAEGHFALLEFRDGRLVDRFEWQ
jgi:hypothetical protein